MPLILTALIISIIAITGVEVPDITVNEIKPRIAQPVALQEVKIKALVYAYTSTEAETDKTPFITASGDKVRDGIIACPRKYKFGTKFIIDDREYICLDRMNSRYENNELEVFDIWHKDLESAKSFGKQIKEIIIK